jgi:four helix bundle protein
MRFEALDVWKRSKALCVAIYRAMSACKDFGFRDQITRASLSVPSNIAEGCERLSQKECVTFLSYAKGSCGELRTQLHVGMEIGYIGQEPGTAWLREAEEISLMLGALIKTKRSFSPN